MRRAILFLLLSALPLFAGQPWPGIKFTEVRAYAWPIKAVKSVDVILPGMKLRPDVINKEGTVLTPQEVKQLLAAVTGKHRNYAVAMCHIPHNAFVFYDAAREPVAFVEICFGCSNHRIEPEGAAGRQLW
jgi:hypothetical protein